jgi:hypothetical protein
MLDDLTDKCRLVPDLIKKTTIDTISLKIIFQTICGHLFVYVSQLHATKKAEKHNCVDCLVGDCISFLNNTQV